MLDIKIENYAKQFLSLGLTVYQAHDLAIKRLYLNEMNDLNVKMDKHFSAQNDRNALLDALIDEIRNK
jgi:hypothetical protein